MISKIKVEGRESFLKIRQESIGGSDAASVLGLNQYNSAYALWCEKTGLIVPEDISDKESVRLGIDLENYVAERFAEATGLKVKRTSYTYKNSEYPFAHANPDRLVVGCDAGLEIKTTSSWEVAQKLKNGEIPENWYCQMVHYMMVTGAKKWYLAALVFGVGFFHFTVERDEAEIAALARAERDFWKKVCDNTPPPLDGSEATAEAIKTIYKDSTPGTSVDLTTVGQHISLYNQVSKQIKELETIKAEQENIIKNYMGQAEKGTYGETSISWKKSSRSSFDRSAYEADNGKIPENYFKTSEVRTFRVSVKKG